MATHKATGAIIEGIAVRRRKEESSRAHVTFSFPVKGNEELYMAATLNQGNAVDLVLQILQGDMFSAAAAGDDDDEDEDPEAAAGELEQIFGSGDDESGDPLIDKLLEGAQEPTDEERAQALANLASESSVPADPEPHEPPLPLRSRRR